MKKKPTHTEKLLQAILEQNPGITLEEAWRIYRRKYEQDVELKPEFAEGLQAKRQRPERH